MIGVTSFFRDRRGVEGPSPGSGPEARGRTPGDPLRVWTPATATGEEAYSIAMMLLKELAQTGKKRDIQVFATDVNERALDRAREGKYPASITADVPQEYVRKYFTSTGDGAFLQVNKEVRESVVFARQDLLTDPPFSKLDLIICRNFLIYLEPEAQEKSITLFHYALKEGGYLFLGNAETVGGKSRFFRSIGRKQCRVYRKLETIPASRLPVSVPYARERHAPVDKQARIAEQSGSLMEIIQEKLLEEYAPAAVAIDQNYEIIYHNGPTNRYLFQPRGVPTQNFLELVPEGLRSRIRGALYRSGREERPVVVRTSVAGDDNKKRNVLHPDNEGRGKPLHRGLSGGGRAFKERSRRTGRCGRSLKRRRSTSSKANCPRRAPISRAHIEAVEEHERGVPVLERGIAGRQRGA